MGDRTRAVVSGRRLLVAVVAMFASPIAIAHAHPVHMSVTEIRYDRKGGSVDLIVKVFADDFSTAAARYSKSHLDSGKIIDRSRGFGYLVNRLRLANRGSAIPMIPCGVTVSGDTLLFCLRAITTGDPKSLSVSNTLMMELFSDQVNVVQSINGKRRSSRMFVRGDGWKPIT